VKFGPVPLAQAEGAILAHSQPMPGGRLRKGTILTVQILAALAQAGLYEVTVARLEAGDVHEDAAALRLARAAAEGAADLRLGPAFTGRVNLIAARAGVVLLDVPRIIAANEVDSGITIATVPAYHQIAGGGLVATVKLIPYAVPGQVLDGAAAHLHGTVRLVPPIYRDASLIVTEVPGGIGRKGEDAITARLRNLDMSLAETRSCAHDEAALADALRAASGEMILILTASATSDPKDTAPMALARAGGTLSRFGIPVDPGNLLFLGDLGGKPVIGLPGSARSPVLHGADWVLARVACGLQIAPRDFAAMGVGGLLKEIPTRPQPRRGPRG